MSHTVVETESYLNLIRPKLTKEFELVKLRLRHYGNSHYKKNLFKSIEDISTIRNKPKGGLWTSPVESEYGWKDWCKDNDWGNITVYYDLTFEGTVFEIDGVEDMNNLPWSENGCLPFVSFEPLIFMGYDAIHLTARGERETRFTYPKSLYGWDCETVLVMNPDSIKENKR